MCGGATLLCRPNLLKLTLMDIAAWQELHAHDGGIRAAEAWQGRQMNLSPSQRAAVWAWQHPSPRAAFEQADAGPLTGVPFVAKDLFHLAGAPTLAGGTIHSRPQRKTSRLIAKLESLGAVLTAKTHLHEFAYGLTGENLHYGNVEHPHHVGYTAGGSSSGSAAAVAAGIVPFALGTDTAGSLRVPAAYCGLYSWRGQPREAWISDVFPLAPSYDTAGWLTTTAADTSKLWQLVYGTNESLIEAPRGAYLDPSSLGVTAPESSTDALTETAAQLVEETLVRDHPLAVACRNVDTTYSVLQSTEAFAVHQSDLDRKRSAYGKPVWGRIDRGRHWTAAQMDQARLHALRIKAAFDSYFADYDYLVTPITLEPAPQTSDTSTNIRDQLLKLNTHVSIAGRPALSLPVRLPRDKTIGLQIVFNHCSSPSIPAVLKWCESCFRDPND